VLLRETLDGEAAHVRPDDGATVEERTMFPVNPARLETVMVDVPLAPARTFTVVGLAAIVKSCIVYPIVVVWVRVPLVPVTVAV
jgi:hypothetical protein